MSYLLDALNKSGNNSTGNADSQSSPTHSSQNQPSQAMMYHQAAFEQDEGINVYKWVSIVLALILTLLLGIVLGNKFMFQSNEPITTVAAKPDTQAALQPKPIKAQTAAPIAESAVVPATTQNTTSTTPAEIEQAVTAAVSRAPIIAHVIDQAAKSDEQLVISGNRTQPNPVNSMKKETGLNNISNDLLQKFNDAIEQSENPTTAEVEEEEQQLKQSDERIEQYFSHIATIDELTPQMQADIPDLIYGTHIFSTDADQRWVKINDQTLQERQWLNDDIQVIEIQQQFVVFEMRHTRFSLLALTDWIKASPN